MVKKFALGLECLLALAVYLASILLLLCCVAFSQCRFAAVLGLTII
jgi:hypothetical protein